MPVRQLLNTLDSGEISEWMAYDMTQSEDWVKKYNEQIELEKSRQMTDAEKLEAFKRLLGGR